jgi:hypothetical protein
VARAAVGLSGGDLFNVCVNAIHAASEDPNPDRWLMTTEILLAEVERVRAAKHQHQSRGGRRAPVGFPGAGEERELEA